MRLRRSDPWREANGREYGMPDILGEYVDRLVNIELKNRALPRGFMRQFYEAALAEGGGRPLTLRAAEGLIAKVHERDNVLILTGAGMPPAMPGGGDGWTARCRRHSLGAPAGLKGHPDIGYRRAIFPAPRGFQRGDGRDSSKLCGGQRKGIRRHAARLPGQTGRNLGVGFLRF